MQAMEQDDNFFFAKANLPCIKRIQPFKDTPKVSRKYNRILGEANAIFLLHMAVARCEPCHNWNSASPVEPPRLKSTASKSPCYARTTIRDWIVTQEKRMRRAGHGEYDCHSINRDNAPARIQHQQQRATMLRSGETLFVSGIATARAEAMGSQNP